MEVGPLWVAGNGLEGTLQEPLVRGRRYRLRGTNSVPTATHNRRRAQGRSTSAVAPS
jgi:hypothetical protein